ncbi:MAG: TrbL/VirB6 family protein [Propionibacteriaceae bacterium]
MPIDPFGSLGSTIANAVADTLTAAMLSLWNAGLWVLRAVLELEDAILTPNIGEQGPVGDLYAITFWIALALVGILILVQIGVALGKRDGRSIGRLLVGAAQFGFVWFAWVGYGVTLVAASSGLTKALMGSLLNITAWSQWKPWEPFTARDITNGTVAVILGIMGLLLWLAAIAHTLVMLARSASLIVLAAVTPISAAGLVTDFGRSWFWKSFRWFHAAALTPPLMVLALGVGVKITTGVALGADNDVLKSIGTAFVGVILICVSAFSPLALYRLFAFTDPGSTSGSALRAGLAAAGGIGGVLGGQQVGSTAATTTDGAGRTAGEDGAASTTLGRFAAGLGPVGDAVSTGIGIMATLGATGATMGADLTNQMGVGHNNFPPDYPRRGMRAANGQAGSAGGTDIAANNPNTPDDPTLGNTSDESGGIYWGGPPADSVTAGSQASTGPGALPGLPGSSGGSAAQGAVSSSEVAEVAEVAAL